MARPATNPSQPSSEAAYLRGIGDRVRALRAGRKLTRKALAAASGVSERYLAQLESGRGNISVLLLRLVAQALGAGVEELVREASAGDAARAQRRVALLGLRGAGKSSIGARLAESIAVPFIELDHEVEKEAGATLGDIFSMYGQDGYRRFERRALARVLRQGGRAVIATGGSIVTEPEAYRELLAACFTVWLKASPEEHMQRVIAQGDLRPMQGRAAAMDELRRILQQRARLYAQADAVIDTTGRSVRQCVSELRRTLEPA